MVHTSNLTYPDPAGTSTRGPDSTRGLGGICTTYRHHDTPVMTALAQILESAWFCGLELPLRVSQSFDHLRPGALTTPRGRCSLLSLTGPPDRAGAVALGLDSKADARGWREGLSALPTLPEQSGVRNIPCPWRPGRGQGCSLFPPVRLRALSEWTTVPSWPSDAALPEHAFQRFCSPRQHRSNSFSTRYAKAGCKLSSIPQTRVAGPARTRVPM